MITLQRAAFALRDSLPPHGSHTTLSHSSLGSVPCPHTLPDPAPLLGPQPIPAPIPPSCAPLAPPPRVARHIAPLTLPCWVSVPETGRGAVFCAPWLAQGEKKAELCRCVRAKVGALRGGAGGVDVARHASWLVRNGERCVGRERVNVERQGLSG